MKSPKKKAAARKPARRSGRGAGPDAVAMLKADHRKVEGLFKKAEKAKGGAKEKLVEQICNELIIHTMLEEEIFYPACRSEDVEEDKMDEAQVEHDGAKVMINDLMQSGASAPMYDAKVKVLSEYIKHHVKEEEQPRKGLFAEAKRKGVDMNALGARMKARKLELMREAEEEGLPRPEPKSIGAAPKSNGDGARADEADGGMGGRLRHFVQEAKRRHFSQSAKRALD
ncbi:hemerythrin domain-containing protein [Dongia sp.]|uniref:hemerythrin domain-containing protein n=1 Tax=Dongia sp. TaxID=1977262 RepID=UPI0037532E20